MEYVSNGKFAQVDVFPAACYLQSAPIVLLLNQINFYKFTSSQVLTIAWLYSTKHKSPCLSCKFVFIPNSYKPGSLFSRLKFSHFWKFWDNFADM